MTGKAGLGAPPQVPTLARLPPLRSQWRRRRAPRMEEAENPAGRLDVRECRAILGITTKTAKEDAVKVIAQRLMKEKEK
jgi:hypothetical protein